MHFVSNHLRALSNDQLRIKAPAVFAEQPHSKTSDRYLFVPTIRVIDKMRQAGWEVVSASQQGNRKSTEEAKLSNKHSLFFARRDYINSSFQANETLPLLKLDNSHNAGSSFQLSAGFFRKACANGLTLPDSIYASPTVKHTVDLAHDVVEATFKVLSDFPKLMHTQEQLRSIMLTNEEKLLLADCFAEELFTKEDRERAQQLAKRYGSDRYLLESQLLSPVRYDDRKNDLWSVMNVAQERTIKGLINVSNDLGRRVSKRKVTSLDRDREIHNTLFKITEFFAKQKGVSITA